MLIPITIMPLLNIGIKVSQLFMILLLFYSNIIKVEHFKWNLIVSGAGLGIAATILLRVFNAE